MRDVSTRPILWAAAAIAGTVGIVIVSVFALLHFAGTPVGGERLRFDFRFDLDAPGLSSAPQPQLERYRREKARRLDSAGWVEQEAGIAHIPIADAMDLLAQRAAQTASAPGKAP